jgi:hypothetical protein
MTWSELKRYIGKPISTLPQKPEAVTESILRLGPAYLFTIPDFVDLSPSNEPIISLVIWAPSVGAVKRAFERAIEEDDASVAEPPQEMLLVPNANTWAKILAEGKSQNIKFLESGSYRIMTDGAFIHKQLESRHYRAYFRSPTIDANELPYAIAVSA